MEIKDNTYEKSGVNWKYLESIREINDQVLDDYFEFRTNQHQHTQKKLICSLSKLYLSVSYSFNKWLDNNTDNEFKLSKAHYRSLTRPNIQTVSGEVASGQFDKLPTMNVIVSCVMLIQEWMQSKGPFATLIKSIEYDSIEAKLEAKE